MSESNIDFMIQPQLKFSQDESGLEYIEIENRLATAKIALPVSYTHLALQAWWVKRPLMLWQKSIVGAMP